MGATPTSDKRMLGPRELQGIQTLIDALPFYAMLVDGEHTVLAVNESTRDALGLEPEEIICGYCPRVVHGSEEPFPGCPLERAVDRGGHVETEMYDEDHQSWVRSSVSPTDLVTEDGRQVYLHFTHDITDKKQAQQALAHSKEHHQAVAEILQAIQASQTASAVLEQVIDRVRALSWMGLSGSAAGFLEEQGQLRLVTRRNLPPTVERQCATVELGQCICGRAALERSVSYSEHGPQDVTPVEDHGHVVLPLSHQGRLLGLINFYTPAEQALDPPRLEILETVAGITAVALDRLKMQAELVHSDRVASMGLLASVVAHEIRTPLNALSINVQMLSRKLRRNQELSQQQLMDLIDGLKVEVQRINNQIEDHLLAIVRQRSTTMRPARINDLVQESIQFMRAEADFKQVELSCELAEQVPPILADPNKVRRILLNIILNAIQAMPDGGTVRVSTAPLEREVMVSISDTGPGLDQVAGADLDQIFLPLVTTKRDGTGLGLAICSRLVKEMGGRIRVSSERGSGARFDVFFQAAEEEQLAASVEG